MSNSQQDHTSGLQSLVKYYRSIFKIEENCNHYDKHDYKNAEREFVKYALANRIVT